MKAVQAFCGASMALRLCSGTKPQMPASLQGTLAGSPLKVHIGHGRLALSPDGAFTAAVDPIGQTVQVFSPQSGTCVLQHKMQHTSIFWPTLSDRPPSTVRYAAALSGAAEQGREGAAAAQAGATVSCGHYTADHAEPGEGAVQRLAF